MTDEPRSDRLLLEGSVENYEYLNKSRREVDGIDDSEEWRYLKASRVATFTGDLTPILH